MGKDIIGINRIQEEINKAPEIQSATELLQEVKACSQQLAAVCNATEMLCEKTDKLDTTLDKRLDDIRDASAVVIPPKTIERVKEVFTTFVTIFETKLNQQSEKTISDMGKEFILFKKQIDRHERMIAKHCDRISIPYMSFYCFITIFAYLVAFFAVVLWANARVFHIDQLQNIIWWFGGFIVLSIGVFIVYSIWEKRK